MISLTEWPFLAKAAGALTALTAIATFIWKIMKPAFDKYVRGIVRHETSELASEVISIGNKVDGICLEQAAAKERRSAQDELLRETRDDVKRLVDHLLASKE